jgi:hypothetical protein
VEGHRKATQFVPRRGGCVAQFRIVGESEIIVRGKIDELDNRALCTRQLAQMSM